MAPSCSNLSVVLLTLDVEEVLQGALDSVPPGAEVVVADGGSRDRTRGIARRSGARVVEQDLETVAAGGGNFDLARNAAGREATRPWLLFLDADERISPELGHELTALMAEEPACDAYRIPRVNLYWGRPVRLLGDDFQLRLVRNGSGRFEGQRLHRSMRVEGMVGHLGSPLIHLNILSWRDVVRRFRRDVPVEARGLTPRPGLRQALGTPWHVFRHYYLTHQAWRDGPHGLLVCCLYAAYHGSIVWTARRRRHA